MNSNGLVAIEFCCGGSVLQCHTSAHTARGALLTPPSIWQPGKPLQRISSVLGTPQDGAGAVAELLRDGVFRCVSVIAAAASTPEHTNMALAEAALAAFTSQRLCGLLTDGQQEAAARAVSCYTAAAHRAGPGSLSAPLAALHTLLTAARSSCNNWPVPYDMGLAVVSSGALEPLLGTMEAGSGAPGPHAGDEDSLVALRCLGMSAVACMQGGRPKGHAAVRAALSAAGLQRAVATALRYTGASSDEDCVLALDVLLAAVTCCGGEAVEAVVARVREVQPGDGAAAYALLAAIETLMKSRDAGLTMESAPALLQLLSAMCARGLVRASYVLEEVPGIRDAIAGVLLRKAPGSQWGAFNAIAVEQPVANRYTYPLRVELAAVQLLDQLSQGTGLGGGNGFGVELDKLAAALVRGVLEAKLPGDLESYTMRLRCLVAVLQAMEEEKAGLWYVNNSVNVDVGSGGSGGSSTTTAPDQVVNGVSFG